MSSLKGKLKSCYQRVQRNLFDFFDNANEYLEEPGKGVPESVKHDINDGLRQLQNSFQE
jgi:hypothetical protein